MIKELLHEGFILKSKGFYKHAIETFYKALEIDNTSSELLLEIADCYYLMGEEEKALSYIEQILEKDPTHINTLKLLRNIFINKNALKEAEQTAKNIYFISQNPKDLADIYKLLNKQKHHQEIFEYPADINTAEILYEKAWAKLFLNELNDAENYINQALNLDKNNEFLFLKCKILFKMDKKEDAIQLLNEIEVDENNPDSLNFMGLLKQYECDFKNALTYFNKAIKISPSHEYYYNYASTYFKMGEIKQAKKFYNLAITKDPDNQNYHFALANLYYSEKNYKRAMEELNYDFFEARLLKSIILYDSGYLALAKKEFDKLTEEQPNNELVVDYKKKIEDELKI